MNSFTINKRTQTHSDVFSAVGLAGLLQTCGKQAIIHDQGGSFRVEIDSPITLNDIRIAGNDIGYKYLQTKQERVPEVVMHGHYISYEDEKARADRAREAAKQARAARSEVAFDIAADAPHKDFRLYQTLNILQGDGGPNKAAVWIASRNHDEWVAILFESLQSLDRGHAPAFDFGADLLQLFTPTAAKGYARLKPDSTSRNDKTKEAWAEPFLDWLRYRGFFHAACPYLLGSRGEDVRILVPEPSRIRYRLLDKVVADLRQEVIFGSAAKVDCLATLALARLLIQNSAEYNQFSTPANLVSGVLITHYQATSQFAKAVTSIERLAMPDWFPLHSPEQARLWVDVLDEHFKRLRPLDEKNSDELGMLQQYRRFLEHRGDSATLQLISFLELYGIFVLRQRGQNNWRHKQFSQRFLEEILQQTSYSTIIQSTGFQAIAKALRSVTVSAQSLKRNKRDHREIRYDILPELRRKRLLPDSDQFLESVSDFVASYNAESARRLEQGKPSGIARVAEDDLAAFYALFDQGRAPSLIGALLCAYATCRASEEAQTEPEEGDETDANT